MTSSFYKRMQLRIYDILEPPKKGDHLSKITDFFIMTMILLNISAIILESFNRFYDSYASLFRSFETFSVLFFSIEYLLRIWVAPLKHKDLSPFRATLKYAFSIMAIIDLAAVLPFYLRAFIRFDLRFLRMFRLSRLLRLFKFNRYTKAFMTIGKVVKNSLEELLATSILLFFLMIMSATMMYYFENPVQPEAFPNIVASFWWAVATLTTVGYGDIFPITFWGKVFASIIAILGIGIVALPTGIISSGFISEVTKNKKQCICPHCNKKFDSF